jgi:hypothetical protein
VRLVALCGVLAAVYGAGVGLAQDGAAKAGAASQGSDPTGAAAQDKSAPFERAPYAVIFGTLWDPDSRAVYGVHMQLRRAGEKKVRWEAFSDHRGEFAFRVPSGKGDYELSADSKSLKTLKTKGLLNLAPVKVHVDYDEQVDTGVHLTK